MSGPPWKAIRSSTSFYFCALALLFMVSRIPVFLFPNPATDVAIYAAYAQEFAEAGRENVSFYDYHVRKAEQQVEEFRTAGRHAELLEEYQYVEYPPLALALLRMPTLWMENPGQSSTPALDFRASYYRAFRLGMAFVDTGLWVFLLLFVRRLFPLERLEEQVQRSLVYLGATLFLWHLLYDRLDLILAALVLGAFALLTSKRHYIWSFVALAVAINFKIIPIVLAPIWMVGALPARQALIKPRLWLALAVRSFVLIILTASIFLPFYWRYGGRALDFVTYHRLRGLEIGSLYSSLQMLLRPWGHPVSVGYSYGGVNVSSDLAPRLVTFAPYIAILILLAFSLVLLVAMSRLARNATDSPSRTLAQCFPQVFLGYTLLFLMLFVASNKVFSPQYLLWLAPLVCLLPFPTRARGIFQTAFLAVCLLTTLFFPYLFSDLAVPIYGLPAPFWHFREPSLRIALVLGVRNVLFAALTVWLGYYVVRQPRRLGENG